MENLLFDHSELFTYFLHLCFQIAVGGEGGGGVGLFKWTLLKMSPKNMAYLGGEGLVSIHLVIYWFDSYYSIVLQRL